MLAMSAVCHVHNAAHSDLLSCRPDGMRVLELMELWVDHTVAERHVGGISFKIHNCIRCLPGDNEAIVGSQPRDNGLPKDHVLLNIDICRLEAMLIKARVV